MGKVIQVKFRDVPGKRDTQAQININEQVDALLTSKNITIEMTKLDENHTSVYAVSGDQDIACSTFNPNSPDQTKQAFMKIVSTISENY